MSFVIPSASSKTSLFVVKTDFYTKKDTGEVRASVQALSPIPAGVNGNGKGFELTEFNADASVLDSIDLTNGPAVYEFECAIRPITNRFGQTTNTQVLVRVVDDKPAQRTAQDSRPVQQPAKPQGGAAESKS